MSLIPLPDEFIHRPKSSDQRFCEAVCTHCGKTIASSPCTNWEPFLRAAELAHRCSARIISRGLELAA